MSSTNPQSFNFCPHCGTDIKDTGYEQFGCWSCGHSVNSDNKIISRKISPSLRDKRLLDVFIQKIGSRDLLPNILRRLHAKGAYSYLLAEIERYEWSRATDVYLPHTGKGYKPGGIFFIAKERNRQAEEEGWTPEHDDQHTDGQLAAAAAVYADQANYSGEFDRVDAKGKCDVLIPRDFKWPWDKEYFKPTPDDRISELSKAGALIAAEIDRNIRKKERETK